MDYRATLNLPQTSFKMKANLSQKEPEFLKQWEKEDLYGQVQAEPKNRPLYIPQDGPPYANGHIHLGTAFNKVLKDIILKSKRMAGFHCPYVPGWDCHGLPIEHNVDKELGAKKKDIPVLSAIVAASSTCNGNRSADMPMAASASSGVNMACNSRQKEAKRNGTGCNASCPISNTFFCNRSSCRFSSLSRCRHSLSLSQYIDHLRVLQTRIGPWINTIMKIL